MERKVEGGAARPRWVVIIVVSLVLFAGGLGLGLVVSQLTGGTISRDEAVAIAEAHFPGTSAVEVRRGIDSGVPVWDIELSNGATVDVRMSDGEIIDVWGGDDASGSDASGGDAASLDAPASPPAQDEASAKGITQEQAVAIALARIPGTSVVEAKMGTAYGVPVWDIELSNGASVEVDRANGEIVEIWGGGEDWENPAYNHDN